MISCMHHIIITLGLAVVTAIHPACSDRMTPGTVALKNGERLEGGIDFEQCRNDYVADPRRGLVIVTPRNGVQRRIDAAAVETVITAEGAYRFVDGAAVSGGPSLTAGPMAARVIVEGRARLMALCAVRFRSTMFSSKRDEVVFLIAAPDDAQSLTAVPVDGSGFRAFCAKHFGACCSGAALPPGPDSRLDTKDIADAFRRINACRDQR